MLIQPRCSYLLEPNIVAIVQAIQEQIKAASATPITVSEPPTP
jgi:hypothetical protein